LAVIFVTSGFSLQRFFSFSGFFTTLLWLRNGDLQATIFVIGFLMAAVLNPIANLWAIFLFFTNRNKLQAVPKWLLLSNAAFLVAQLIYIIYRNGR
jgi:hypothetical protein